MKADGIVPEATPLLPTQQHPRRRRANLATPALVLAVLATALLLATLTSGLWKRFASHPRLADVDRARKCSVDNLHANLSFLDSARPIEADEFLERRDRLARALAADGVDAFVLEPGYTFQYEPRPGDPATLLHETDRL